MSRILDNLLNMESFDAVSNILNDITLADIQAIDAMTVLYTKRGLLRYDTGMGKTIIASALMKLIKRNNPDAKLVFLMKNAQMQQTPKKISEACGLKVIVSDATQGSVENLVLNRNFLNYDVILLTHECLNNARVMQTLFSVRDRLTAVFIDEAHELQNYLTSDSAMMLKAFIKHREYVYALTATPITTATEQLARLLRMLVPELVPSVVQLKRDLEHDASILNTRFRGIYISRTRKDIGVESNYIPHVHTVKPMGSQRGMSGAEMFKYTRGQGAYNQVNKLIEVIKSHRPGKGIVFVWQHVVRNFVEGELRNTDIKFESISGLTNNKERARIMKEFNEGKLDTVLISTKTSVDLDSDYVFFYEFTVDVRQVIGRAERGLNPKDLHIHWLFTQETGEFDYFKENIYNRSLLVRNVVGTQCDDLDEVATTIGG